MAETDWAVQDGAIVERPREVRAHPLLAEIYEHHDARIASHLSAGETLELAFGRHMHPDADVGVEAWPSNARAVPAPTVAGDARSLPFAEESFDAVVGRRFLHHVPPADRAAILRESRRILRPGGKLVLLEGTPGLYRRLTKGAAFRLGVLDEDTDIYGHLSERDVEELVEEQFDLVESATLGSPFMLASIAQSALATALFPLYERTQFVKWWTFAVGQKSA